MGADHPRFGRRDLLQVGGMGQIGVGLADLLRLEAEAAESGPRAGKAKSVVFIFQSGGPSQHETFDPNPHVPDMIRGEYGVAQTRIPGELFCEHLPRLAFRSDRFSVVRTMNHIAGREFRNEHESCMSMLHTGTTSLPVGDTNASITGSRSGRMSWPSIGSMIAYAAPPNADDGLSLLKPLSGLNSLKLTGTKLRGDGLVHVATLVHLENLDLEQTKLQPASVPVLATLCELRSLILPAGMTTVDVSPLTTLSRLEVLSICDSELDDAGVAFVTSFPNLRKLQLNGAHISDSGLASLTKLIELEDLNLTSTGVTDAGLVHLQPLLKLRRLSVNGTSITLSGVVRLFVRDQRRSLADAMRALGLAAFDEQGQIVSIDVAGTDFGDEEMQHVAPLTTLKELHLASTKVTDAGMVHVKPLVN